MNIEFILQSGISAALHQLFSVQVPPATIALQPTRKDFDGQLTLVVFPFTKAAGKSPEETGRLIGEYLTAHTLEVSGYNVVKGFLNLEIASGYWVGALAEMARQEQFGTHAPNGETVVVEFSSPNTNKPIHLGHLRNNFLGASISNILSAAGYKVIRANLINDRGIHICKSMLAYKLLGNNETPESSGMKGDHLVGKYYVAFDTLYQAQIKELIEAGQTEEEAKKKAPAILQAQDMLVKWEAGDPETTALWEKLDNWVLAGFAETYKRIGVSFDTFYRESNTYLPGKEVVQEGLKNGVFYQKPDGSVWIDLEAEGLDHKLVQRADGTSVYITQDLGTADLKYADFHAGRSIYVVGNEQDYHFKVLFLIMKKLGRPYADGMFHLSYGMVELPDGVMKSRKGTVVDADDLLDGMVSVARARSSELGKIAELEPKEQEELFHLLGLGAIKYYLLKVEPKRKMLFNPEESIELQGNTATSIQYTHARIRTIERRAAAEGIVPAVQKDYALHPAERDLILLMATFPDKVAEAAAGYAPSVICNYVYEVSKAYNSFFSVLSIFSANTAEETAFRVLLSGQVGLVIKKGMELIGVGVPERM